MKFKKIALIVTSVLFIYCVPFKKGPIAIHMIGDSTMANKELSAFPETGWGQVFNEYFNNGVSIHNHAINGYSTKSFITNNKWQPVLDSLKEGDYVFIEFGHNDEKVDQPGGSTLAAFHDYLVRYVTETRAKKAIPVLLTPIMRRTFTGNVIRDTHGGYPDVTRAVAKEYHVLLIDMHRKSEKMLNEMGNADSKKLYNWIDSGVNANYPKGVKDNTHLTPIGAHKMAELAVEGVKESAPALAKYIKAQIIPAKEKVLADMTIANSYFMQKWPDPGKEIAAKQKVWASNIWTRAVYYEGLMALYRTDKKPAYYKYMIDWGEKHQWNLDEGSLTRDANNQCCGQTYIDLYLMDKNPDQIKAIKSSVDLMLSTNKIDDWTWIDALQMGMPVFSQLGTVFNNPAYFDRMYKMYAFTKYKEGGNGLYNAKEHLWWRDKAFCPPYKEPNGRNCYWSRGNGWVLAALVRILQTLPKTDAHYPEYLQDYKDMCQALLILQRPDGCWNVSLTDPTHFGGKEVTGTSLFLYGFSYGINQGLLDKSLYLPSVIRGWDTLTKDCLHANGFLGYVQGTGQEPKDGQPLSYDKVPDFEDYGLGCFLLAGSEIYKLK